MEKRSYAPHRETEPINRKEVHEAQGDRLVPESRVVSRYTNASLQNEVRRVCQRSEIGTQILITS